MTEQEGTQRDYDAGSRARHYSEGTIEREEYLEDRLASMVSKHHELIASVNEFSTGENGRRLK